MKRPELILERELLDLFGAGRNARIVARYRGLDGRGGGSLQSVGRVYGVTRERIRQIVTAASSTLYTGRPIPPVLNRTIAFVADRMPAAAREIEAEMRSAGLTAGLFRLEGVIKAAEMLGKRVPFAITEVNGERLVHAQDIPPFDSIVRIARRVVAQYGMTTVSDVSARVRMRKGVSGVCDTNLVASVLGGARAFRWLDQSAGWFWLKSQKNPVLRRIRKIVSVANPIGVSELQAGIVRDHRMKGFSPPQRVLLEFCRQALGLHVCDDTIAAKPRLNPDAVLSQIERQMVRVLSDHGGTMTVTELRSVCLRMGLNQRTCYLYLVHAPFISKFGYNLYGLVGSGGKLVNGSVHLSTREAGARHSAQQR